MPQDATGQAAVQKFHTGCSSKKYVLFPLVLTFTWTLGKDNSPLNLNLDPRHESPRS